MPIIPRDFIPADVDEFAGKKFHYLSENVFQKPQCLLVARTENSRRNRLCHVSAVRPASAAELGISSQGCAGVPGHFKLRHDGDVPGLGVRDNLPDFVLSVKAPISPVRSVRGGALWIQVKTDSFAPRPYL